LQNKYFAHLLLLLLLLLLLQLLLLLLEGGALVEPCSKDLRLRLAHRLLAGSRILPLHQTNEESIGKRGLMLIASASGTEDCGFKYQQGCRYYKNNVRVWFYDIHTLTGIAFI
jgi:hypothetical protein